MEIPNIRNSKPTLMFLAITLMFLALLLPVVLCKVPMALTLEREFPTNHEVELSALRGRDLARHGRMLADSSGGGVIDFAVDGNSDLIILGVKFSLVFACSVSYLLRDYVLSFVCFLKITKLKEAFVCYVTSMFLLSVYHCANCTLVFRFKSEVK